MNFPEQDERQARTGPECERLQVKSSISQNRRMTEILMWNAREHSLSCLTNSALEDEPKCGGRIAGSQPMSKAVQCIRSQKKLTQYFSFRSRV
jgi:hypothetical protein